MSPRIADIVKRQLPSFLFGVVVLLAWTGCVPAVAQQNQKVKIVEMVWGFDGRVVTGQFNPLSILIDNLSEDPIEGDATLRLVTGMINEVGGVATKPVFIGGTSRQWVQFYPYVPDRATSWNFSLRTPDMTLTFDPIDQPRAVFEKSTAAETTDQSLPAVILDPPGMGSRAPTTIKHMPAEIFPPYATATHGLYALFLDHVPDWDGPRQEAMLSWLKSGGRLHLLLDSNNQTLRFPGLMSPLNEPFPEFAVGNGTVTRHDVQRTGLTIQMVIPAVKPPELSPEETQELSAFNQTSRPYRNYGLIDADEMFSELRALTQPDHAWWLIFLLSLCYIGLIFPGCWILSKQRKLHFLITYGAIAGLATFFSLLFLVIGRRGYGESTSLHTMAVARAEDDTHWSSFEYNTLFVTAGDVYSIDEKDRQTLMASASTDERVDAKILSGNTASFVSRIPPFSSQSLVARRRITTDNWNLAVTGFSQNGPQLSGLTLTFNDKFPVGDKVECWIMHGRDIHKATIDSSTRQLTLGNQRDLLRTFCDVDRTYDQGATVTMFGIQPNTDQYDTDPLEKFFQTALKRMTARSLADDFVNQLSAFRVQEGRIRLLVYVPIPDSLGLPVSAPVRREGRILFVKEMALQMGGEEATEK